MTIPAHIINAPQASRSGGRRTLRYQARRLQSAPGARGEGQHCAPTKQRIPT